MLASAAQWLAMPALLAWVYLLALHGRFWKSGPELPAAQPVAPAPPVCVVVPARDEAASVAEALQSLLAQDYPGRLDVVLVDDGSSDGTGDIARAVASLRQPAGIGAARSLKVIEGAARPAGWSGKLWAVAQGVAAAPEDAAFLLLTDADILHAPTHLAALVAKAQADRLDLVSEMVALHCASWAERALVPAFVYFFQMLFPFARVANPNSRVAAAAGGTILIATGALWRVGGIAAIRGALIDDVALARAVKKGAMKGSGGIWLGHTTLAHSIRPYPGAADIWRMVARTAYVQLRTSPVLLVGTVLGLGLIWVVPPATALFGTGLAQGCGTLAWILSAWSYMPTLRRFGRFMVWAPFLPLVALFYMAATIGSAIDHHRGRGVVWKRRAYQDAGS